MGGFHLKSSGSLAAPHNKSHPFGGAFHSLSFVHACDLLCGIDPERLKVYTTLSKKDRIMKRKKIKALRGQSQKIIHKIREEEKEWKFILEK